MAVLQKRIARSLLALGGCDPKRVDKVSEAERLSYMRYGMMLFASVSFMTLVTASSMYFATGSVIGAGIVAVLLGLVILGIDSTILQSEARQDGYQSVEAHGVVIRTARSGHALTKLIGRIALSVMMCSFVVSIGELRLYDQEIRSVLHEQYMADNRALYTSAQGRVDAGRTAADQELGKLIDHRDAIRSQIASLSNPFEANNFDRELQGVDAQIATLRSQIADLRETSIDAIKESGAEEAGQKRSETSSGLPGTGPRYRAAVNLDKKAGERVRVLQAQLDSLQQHRNDVQNSRNQAEQAASTAAKEARPEVDGRLAVAEKKVAAAREKLKAIDNDREAEILRQMEADPAYVEPKEGLLARAAAYQSMLDKSPAAWTLSWLAKIAVILLETMAIVVRIMTRGPSHAGAIMVLDTDRGISDTVVHHVRMTAKLEKESLSERHKVADAKIELERKETELAQARTLRKFFDELPPDDQAT